MILSSRLSQSPLPLPLPRTSRTLPGGTALLFGQRLAHDADRIGLRFALDLGLVGATVGAGLVGPAGDI